MTSQQLEDRAVTASLQRPAVVTALIVATAVLGYRALAIVMLGDVGELPDGPPESWFVPMLGDVFVGVGAVITAILLSKRSTYTAWLTAVIFHTFAFADILQAIVNAIREPYDGSLVGDLMLPVLWLGALISVVNVYLLSRRDLRQYFQDKNAL